MSMINGTRLYDHLTQLGRIGFVPKEGTTRLPYTPAYDEGRIYVQQCMEQAGLQTSVDPVGNLIGTLPGQGEIICIGSHIDTVPGGGIYDGTYGVLSGIECVQRLKELGYQNRHPIQVIAFTEEEGNVIGGTFGSKAFTGGEIDEAMRPNLALHGLTMEHVGACRRDLTQYQCYLELHIEQGGVLEAERMQIGVVDGIVGIVRYRMTVSGCANHAGSTPMHLRDDALVKACRIITQLMERTEAASPDMVCTVGTLQVFPGAVNVIPGKVEFIVELRNPTMEPMDQVIDSVLKEHPELVGEEYIRQSPTQCSSKLIKLSETLCRNRGIRFRRMFSGAGHDLMNWGKAVPSMLLFIPSKDGISHSIREYSAPEDLYQGAELLMEMVQALDQEEGKIVKIKIINPNTTQSMTESIENLARRVARSDTQVWAVTPASGPDSIECYVDEYLAVPGVLKEVIRGDREEGADAFIIACFGDPGLQAAREVTSKPVLGICESAIAAAKFIAPYFSIVSVLDRSRKVTEDVVSNYGAEKFCRSIRSTGLSVLEFGRDPKKGLEALAYQGKLAVQQDGAECILLGCAGFVDFVEDLSAQLGVPVLDGVMPAVKFAEAMVDMGLRTSKVSTWGFPEQKNIVGFPMFTKQELIF